jgi:putative membrane protein
MSNRFRSPLTATLLSISIAATTGPALAEMLGSARLNAADRSFVMMASEANVGEIASGNLAERKASSSSVQLLGKRFVDNHSTNERKLEALAGNLGVNLPMHATATDKMQMQKLSQLSGTTFDAAFLRDEERGHKNTIAAFQQEVANGSNPEVIAYAKASLPVLEEHLDIATDDMNRLMAASGGSSTRMNGDDTH